MSGKDILNGYILIKNGTIEQWGEWSDTSVNNADIEEQFRQASDAGIRIMLLMYKLTPDQVIEKRYQVICYFYNTFLCAKLKILSRVIKPFS